MIELDGMVYIPIPHDPADAYRLYQTDALFRGAIDIAGGVERNAKALLHSGPNCIQVHKHELGVYE